MLNPFPIQWLALFAHLILRVFVAGVLLYLGIRHLRWRRELADVLVIRWWQYGTFTAWTFALGEIVLALLIFTGTWTQYAALAVIAMCIKMIIMRQWFNHPTIPPKIFYVLLLGAAISLFITGAGVLAFDLPI